MAFHLFDPQPHLIFAAADYKSESQTHIAVLKVMGAILFSNSHSEQEQAHGENLYMCWCKTKQQKQILTEETIEIVLQNTGFARNIQGNTIFERTNANRVFLGILC